SPSWDEELEFFSIKVPDGPLTEHLQKIQPGDAIWMRKKPTGTLIFDALRPGRRLVMLSTGTGIAPFASIIRDPEAYEKFGQLVLAHTCREVPELAYGHHVVADARGNEFIGELINEKPGEALVHFTSTTREQSPSMGRITDLITSGAFFERIAQEPLDPAEDRVMICGSMAMLKDTQAILEGMGFEEGATNKPGDYVIERAFVG
ncbi:MAG: ferredoxin--NADP reductase, partial [Pseudomonadota bacterium]